MNLTIEFKKPEAKGSFDWQVTQEVNVSNDNGDVIAKAELELITINKHRDAKASYALLEAEDTTDWEIPLNLYFKGQNLSQVLCEKLAITPDVKKAKTHIMIEALSVTPHNRKQGVARYLLKAIADKYAKAQSITVLSMPINWFVEPELCESLDNKDYYHSLGLENETITIDELQQFFIKTGFVNFNVDEKLLAEPLQYQILVASPKTVLAAENN